METRITKTLKNWFPDLYPEEITEGELRDYVVLNHFAAYCNENRDTKQVTEVFKIINLLYQNGSLHDRNAIENEFLSILTDISSPSNLKSQLGQLPKELRPIYIKTILEN